MFIPFNDWFSANRIKGFFAFSGLYILFVPLSVPSSILTLAGGTIFQLAYGKLKGFFLCLLAIYVGHPPAASIAYFIGRFCMKDFIQKNVITQLRVFEAIDRSIKVEGFKLMVLLRM
jgi:uncharacterized membrane protein YdjX (TVP38/TMEM64 family)